MLLILIVDWCCLFSICGWRRHCRARIRRGNVYVNRVHNQLWSTVNANSGHTHRNHSHETCLARLQYATPTPSRPFSPPNSVLLKCASLHLSHSPVSSLSKHTFRQRPSSSCTLPHPLSEASSVNIRRTRSFVAAPVPWCSRHTPPAPRLRSSPPPVLTFIPQPLPYSIVPHGIPADVHITTAVGCFLTLVPHRSTSSTILPPLFSTIRPPPCLSSPTSAPTFLLPLLGLYHPVPFFHPFLDRSPGHPFPFCILHPCNILLSPPLSTASSHPWQRFFSS